MEPSDAHRNHPDLNALTLPELAAHLRQTGLTARLITLAFDEDLGESAHDWTGELMFAPEDQRRVQMRAREPGVLAGVEFLDDLIKAFSQPGEIECVVSMDDGECLEPGSVIAELSGSARAIVRLERTMLNLIARMSAIATRTNHFVTLVQGTEAQICDTRKTTPGLRAFEKYAVRCGGGTTHRMGLHDAVLIKDNHLAGIEGSNIAAKLEAVSAKINQEHIGLWFVQVEVDTLEQLEGVLSAKPGTVDIVLLDNMSTDQLRKAVAMRDALADGTGPQLEASGGISETTVSSIALCGVDRISIGGLTHQAQSIDIGLDAT
tara:strand:+ start:28038 stop:28997 length:960 start_codon:yes stop_codon:yes gene_type:complete